MGFDLVRFVWWYLFGAKQEVVEATIVASVNDASLYDAWWVLYGRR